jgi:hypothetical protein
MKKIWLAAIVVIFLIASAAPAHAQNFDDIKLQSSQSYLRMGMNDTITLTVQLYDSGSMAGIANVPVVLNFLSGSDYMIFDNQLIVTDANGHGSTTIRVNPDNPPERYKLPTLVQVEAVTDYLLSSILFKNLCLSIL